jgi:hypothetical protein
MFIPIREGIDSSNPEAGVTLTIQVAAGWGRLGVWMRARNIIDGNLIVVLLSEGGLRQEE